MLFDTKIASLLRHSMLQEWCWFKLTLSNTAPAPVWLTFPIKLWRGFWGVWCEDNGGGRGDGHHIFMMCIVHSRVMGGNVKSQLIWQKRIACVRSMRCHTKACGSYMAVINAILYGLYGCRWFMAWGRLETQVRGGLGSLFWADRLSIEAQPSFIFTPVPIRASLTSSLWLQQQHQLLVKRRRGKPFL